MPRIYESLEVVCRCGASRTIKRIPCRDYTNWMCRGCVIKAKWADPEYRNHRPKRKKYIYKPRPYKRPAGVSAFGSPEHIAKVSLAASGPKSKIAIDAAVAYWSNPEPRARLSAIMSTPERLGASREASAALWGNPDFAAKYKTDEYREKCSERNRKLWLDPEYRKKIYDAKNTPEFKAKMRKIISSPEYIAKLSNAAANLPRVSSLQTILYSILDDLGVEYFRERDNGPDDVGCVVGPYHFDCVVPRPGLKTLLIECNGNWVHSLPGNSEADRRKAEYINQYHSGQYELKYIWEHEFANYNKVYELLQYWLGIAKNSVEDFDFGQVDIKTCPAADYRLLLSKYHYLANAGRGGIAHGAYLGGELIAVCVFSPLPRQNITVGNFNSEAVRDLSRFCIHPKYQKKNFGSWFISRCIKILDHKYKAVVAYSDTTFNHTGALYAACNFKLDGEVKPEYWYLSSDGWVMHKKTLYNKAVSLGMKEAEYATAFGYHKVFGGKKLRYIYVR